MDVKIGFVTGWIDKTCIRSQTRCLDAATLEATSLVCSWSNLNCTLEVYTDPAAYGDVREDGNSTGMIGAIERGSFDSANPIITPTYRRLKAVSFSDALFYCDVVLMTRAPDQRKTSPIDLSIVQAFRWETWCAAVVTLTLVTAFLDVSFKVGHRISERKDPTHYAFFRTVLFLWSVGTFLLSSAYTSALFSDKLASMRNLPYKDFASFVTCLEQSRCRLVTHTPLTATHIQLLLSPESALGRRALASFKKKPPLAKTRSDVPDAVLNERSHYLVWITPISTLYEVIGTNKDCKFYVIEAPYKDVWTFPVRKGSKLLPIFNKAAVSFQEYGLAHALQKRYWGQSVCRQEAMSQPDFQSTNITTMCILGVGLLVSIAAFVMEILAYRAAGEQVTTAWVR